MKADTTGRKYNSSVSESVADGDDGSGENDSNVEGGGGVNGVAGLVSGREPGESVDLFGGSESDPVIGLPLRRRRVQRLVGTLKRPGQMLGLKPRDF